jgi:superfamily II DNA or RNA helicase
MFRKHQDEFGQLCHAIASGESPDVRHIIGHITPGGGKSLLPLIAASQLIPKIADRICWIVPRRSLQQQAESEFLAERGRTLLGHNHSVRRSTSEADPCRGLSGFVTTYQAVGMGNAHLREEFAKRRYILVLDEPHHVEEGGAWEAALLPLVQRAALTVHMSGTLERGNRRRIAFLPYRQTPDGEIIDLSQSASTRGLVYTRRDALRDRAIIPIHFELMDGTAQWIGRDGETYSTTLSGAHKDTSEALYTALKTQFAVHLLDECAAHWNEYRQAHPRAKLLVVTAGIDDAKKYLEHLKNAGIRAAIATSDDSAQAARNIEHFRSHGKKRSLDALVTVAMAYEGLDVPAVTHIACLTHIRSKPWIEQMIARATRFDPGAGAWETQTAYIYVPDDKNICAIIGAMQDEQQVAVKQMRDSEEYDDFFERYERAASEERNTITPVGSAGVGRRWNRIGDAPQESASTRESSPPLKTPSQLEAELRERIQSHCKQVDSLHFECKWGETNKRVVKTFGKTRAAMTLSELEKVQAYLEWTYPVASASTRSF